MTSASINGKSQQQWMQFVNRAIKSPLSKHRKLCKTFYEAPQRDREIEIFATNCLKTFNTQQEHLQGLPAEIQKGVVAELLGKFEAAKTEVEEIADLYIGMRSQSKKAIPKSVLFCNYCFKKAIEAQKDIASPARASSNNSLEEQVSLIKRVSYACRKIEFYQEFYKTYEKASKNSYPEIKSKRWSRDYASPEDIAAIVQSSERVLQTSSRELKEIQQRDHFINQAELQITKLERELEDFLEVVEKELNTKAPNAFEEKVPILREALQPSLNRLRKFTTTCNTSVLGKKLTNYPKARKIWEEHTRARRLVQHFDQMLQYPFAEGVEFDNNGPTSPVVNSGLFKGVASVNLLGRAMHLQRSYDEKRFPPIETSISEDLVCERLNAIAL